MPRAGYNLVMLYAMTRLVSAAIGACELTHLERVAMDVARAREQHTVYERALESCGARILRAAALDGMADGVFVEDTAVVLPEGAVMMRPGAASRRGEVASVAEILGRYRELAWIAEPGTVDGGDVLVMGRRIFVGRSSRSNAAGIEQLRNIVRRWGYEVIGVAISGCLHLKSAVTCVGNGAVLVNPAWVDAAVFGAREVISVDAAEAFGANGLLVGGRVIYPQHFPRTCERLRARGIEVLTVACDELAKAEGAVTCCSIVFEA